MELFDLCHIQKESSTDHFAALISRSRKPIAIDRIADSILFEPQIMDNESGSDVPVPLSSLQMVTDIIGYILNCAFEHVLLRHILFVGSFSEFAQ